TGSEQATDQAAAILSGVAWSYLSQWNEADEELSALFHVVPVRPTVSVCFVMSDLDVSYANPEYPLSLTWKGISIDADLRSTAPGGIDSRDSEKPFLLVSGLEGSILENRVFEDRLQLSSVSTAKAIQQAHAAGIEVRDFKDDTSDVPGLPLDPAVKA